MFTANGEYLVGGGKYGVRVWRVTDMKLMATMKVDQMSVYCLAVSTDGSWIAAGTLWGEVVVWNSKTYEKVCRFKEDDETIWGIDFSPDSTRLVAARQSSTAIVWDRPLGKKVQTLEHSGLLRAVKYSPLGDRIATATLDSVRVWVSNDGHWHLLVDIEAGVEPWYNTGLCWFKNHIFVVSEDEIKQFDVLTRSEVSRWPTKSDRYSCIILSQRGEFIAYSTTRTITFWDASTHAQLAVIDLPQDIHPIALSPDDQFLAISEEEKITFQSVSHITVSIVFFAP